ncbi:hypothetical protein BT96DRAFT_1002267 [Gymnopus androsaceus JB14]|uniref:DNA polymerase delta, subunit 4 n=1 Tax=Gymnopus androsaceus JB14 TaxID=1447944 RepID=A0A6A4GYQ5_9AGAR|nr:hypothetical protein BT96DRAFT_1002267 [Gymnopus androsaceus JB14]
MPHEHKPTQAAPPKLKQQDIRDFNENRKRQLGSKKKDTNAPVQGSSHDSDSNEEIQYIGIRTRSEALAANRMLDPSVLTRLREFDWSSKYGPFIGMTRMERWRRAQQLELDPPQDIYLILLEIEKDKDHPWRNSHVTQMVM